MIEPTPVRPSAGHTDGGHPRTMSTQDNASDQLGIDIDQPTPLTDEQVDLAATLEDGSEQLPYTIVKMAQRGDGELRVSLQVEYERFFSHDQLAELLDGYEHLIEFVRYGGAGEISLKIEHPNNRPAEPWSVDTSDPDEANSADLVSLVTLVPKHGRSVNVQRLVERATAVCEHVCSVGYGYDRGATLLLYDVGDDLMGDDGHPTVSALDSALGTQSVSVVKQQASVVTPE